MNTQLLQPYLTRVLIVVIGLLSIGIAPEAKADLRPGASLADVYVDESALVAGGSLVSVIISGPNTDSLYEAVSAVGGVVTSELWLIDAVAATVSRVGACSAVIEVVWMRMSMVVAMVSSTGSRM